MTQRLDAIAADEGILQSRHLGLINCILDIDARPESANSGNLDYGLSYFEVLVRGQRLQTKLELCQWTTTKEEEAWVALALKFDQHMRYSWSC